MNWEDALARQPGGNGPRVLHSSGDFIAFTERLRVGFSFKAEAAEAAGPLPNQTTRAVRAKLKAKR